MGVSEARRLKALAQKRRRLHVLLRREGQEVNRKRVQWTYREEKPMVRKRGGRKRALGTRRLCRETSTSSPTSSTGGTGKEY